MSATYTVKTTSSNTSFTVETAINTSRRTPCTSPNSRIGGREAPSRRTTWCTHRWNCRTATNLFECVFIIIFDTSKLGFTVMSAVMLVTTVWLEVVDPGAKTFLVKDPSTYIHRGILSTEEFILSKIKT